MSADVKQYDISTIRPGSFPIWGRFDYFVTVLSVTFFIRWALERFVPFFAPTRQQDTFDLLFLPVALAAWFAFFPSKSETSLAIGEDFVERRTSIAYYTMTKRITRQQAKSVAEVTLRPFFGRFPRRGLAIRDRGRIGTWLFGFVFVPATIPYRDYEEVKSRLLEWNRGRTTPAA